MKVEPQMNITLSNEEPHILLECLLVAYQSGELDDKQIGFVVNMAEYMGAEFATEDNEEDDETTFH